MTTPAAVCGGSVIAASSRAVALETLDGTAANEGVMIVPALRGHLERLAATPALRRIVVSHHEVIDRDPARVLRDVAATL